jgi:hypothetical protein
MAKEHAKAVRESNLYEHGGARKPLLEKIALLIIRPLEENEVPPDWWRDDFVGWCVLPQERIAAEFGCSQEQVSRNVARFARDGWVTIDTYEAADGSKHNKYAITPAQMAKIKARKMQVDARGHYIRKHTKTKSRKSKQTSMDNLVWSKPLDTESKGSMTQSQEGGCVGVKGAYDTESLESSCNPSFIGKEIARKEKTPEKTENNPLTSFQQGKKENQSQPREPQENLTPAVIKNQRQGSARAPRRAAFKPEVEEIFRVAGAPDIWFEAMAPLTDTVDMLNGEGVCGCPYPLQSWATVAKKHPRFKAAQLWTPVYKGGELQYSSGASLADQIAGRVREESKTPEQHEWDSAQLWWGMLDLNRMHDLVPEHLWTRGFAPRDAILAAYRQHATQRKPYPIPAKKTSVDQLSYADLDAVDPEFA